MLIVELTIIFYPFLLVNGPMLFIFYTWNNSLHKFSIRGLKIENNFYFVILVVW
jgi:hypothetical protein